MMQGALTFQLPQMSTMAPKIDTLYDFLFWSSCFLMLCTTVAMVALAYKYRASVADPKKEVPYIAHNHLLEWGTTSILGAFFLLVFVWGFVGFHEINTIPEDPYEINVVGQKWFWTIQYANGKTLKNELVIPKGRPVKLIMTSRDVIHSFYVPEFRLKQDVLGGMYTTLWMEATHTGEADIYCTEFCGLDHSNMLGKVRVLEPGEFNAWLSGVEPGKIDLASAGHQLFQKRNCIACHSINGKDRKTGPSLSGLFNKLVTLAGGEQVKADDNYIRQSITNPGGQVVQGYAPVMPTYKGLLNEEEMVALVAYVKSLKE